MQYYNDPVDIERPVSLRLSEGFWVGEFMAMASPCEVLFDTRDENLALQLTNIAAREAWRIEQKYSRYREDGIIPKINNSGGKPVTVDAESAMLINFAFHCYQLSDGLFDITSGVLRKVWKFDGSDNVPEQSQIDVLLSKIGLKKVRWKEPVITLPEGMEIDFGGIGKEYAADRVMLCLNEKTRIPMLVNFGGDIVVNKRPANKVAWNVGIEVKDTEHKADQVVAIREGGLATSGDSRRFLLKNGKRYSHIMNPKTGWSVVNPPRSVTVLSNTCVEAGIISTIAMLQGSKAENFLKQQGVKFWVQR